MNAPLIVSDKKPIQIPVGLALHFVTTIILIAIGYAAMQAKIEASLVQAAKNETELKIQREILDGVRMDVRAAGVKLDILMQSYEKDANRYIREPADRR